MVRTWKGLIDTNKSSPDVRMSDFFSSVTSQSHARSNFKYLLRMVKCEPPPEASCSRTIVPSPSSARFQVSKLIAGLLMLSSDASAQEAQMDRWKLPRHRAPEGLARPMRSGSARLVQDASRW